MEDRVHIGLNRTGMKMSPKMRKEMLQNSSAVPTSLSDLDAASSIRARYVVNAGPLGSAPPPLTSRGLASTLREKLSGDRPEVFIDRLGERLAFERVAVRMYELVLVKCEAMNDNNVSRDLCESLGAIRDTERKHFAMVSSVIESLGADPTALTPAADLMAFCLGGLIQAVSDPRVSLVQSFHALLLAELADNEGWDLLVRLAEQTGHAELESDFRVARSEEVRHLAHLKAWHSSMILRDATLGGIRAVG